MHYFAIVSDSDAAEYVAITEVILGGTPFEAYFEDSIEKTDGEIIEVLVGEIVDDAALGALFVATVDLAGRDYDTILSGNTGCQPAGFNMNSAKVVVFDAVSFTGDGKL